MHDAEKVNGLVVSAKETRLKATLIWYLIASLVVLGLIAMGSAPSDKPTIYNASDTTPWWSPVRVFGSMVYALIIPLPHVVISLFFKGSRNVVSVLRVFRGWYKALLAFFVIGVFAAGGSPFVRAQLASLEFQLPQNTEQDAFRVAFACGNLARRLDGEEVSSKIHGYLVSRMSQSDISGEEGIRIIKEAGAFSKYIVEHYSGNRQALAQSRRELCLIAKKQLPDLPI